jgi:hypothetical protein
MAMFWVGVSIAVVLILALTWIGAGMVGGGRPNEEQRRKDGAFIPHDEEFL